MRQTFRQPTYADLRLAVRLRQQARQLKAAARGCQGQGALDRNRAADGLLTRALWLAGKVSNEGYAASLAS